MTTYNQATRPYKVYLELLMVEDIQFNVYVLHRKTCPLDDIDLYSCWLACGLCLMYPYLPERVMRQFDYMQLVP